MAKKQSLDHGGGSGPNQPEKNSESSLTLRSRRILLGMTAAVALTLVALFFAMRGTDKKDVEKKGDGDDTELVKEKERKKWDPVEFFRTFPDQLEGASDVKKFPVANPKLVIAHIRDEHPVWSLVERHEKQMLELVKTPEGRKELEDLFAKMRTEALAADKQSQAVDRDTKAILRHLIETVGIDEVALEGVTEEGAPTYNAVPDMLTKGQGVERRLKKQLSALRFGSPEHNKVKESLDTIVRDRKKTVETMHKELRGAAPFVMTRELRVVPGDDRNTLDLAMRAATALDIDPKEVKKITHGARQEMLIINAIKSGRTAVVVRFGGEHKWGETIEEYKIHSPNIPIALIEVTPKSYKGDEEKKEKWEKKGNPDKK